ncbi:unnamed protein product, partial [Phaeothamnion confervicola]
VVLFDGSCAFCSSGVWLMLEHSKPSAMRFATQSSDIGLSLLGACGLDPDRLSSIALMESNGKLHTRSDAVLQIARRMDFPFPLLAAAAAVVPLPLREAVYGWISENRHTLVAPTDECRIPEEDQMERFLVDP